ncbi:dihydropteroate synthase [Natronoarchaeum philippinense]|uniref:Probable bifunctional folylpolyglutamate synthase/dihydropteroate synthase n=1 Tax=Natronoarchaeum philippinense TaxID=558529 RepID=A0A285P2E8_NATPI|nr:dihydropteroate synthase [Natronoarchaeum philippinense]SNZ15914.1 dihydropteroate synthase [Natronoarchaeum philippinense]
MKFHDAANFLYDLRRFGPRPGIESTADLLSHLDDPHEGLACVQIAGSNGKGSTAKMVESILRETGLTVGLFTSPHLEDLRERIRVDGRKIQRAAVAEFADDIEDYVREKGADGASPTFFEATTAMALWQFARRDVDVAVLEVGIGGKLDATSVVDPVASAVTTVTLEHTDVLGDTIPEIARDKAHVAPADAPLVTGAEGDAVAAIREVADDVVTVGPDGDVVPTYGGRTNHAEAAVSIEGPDWAVDARVPTVGAHQADNAGIAATLARQIGERLGDGPVADAAIERGLRQAHWPGRFEVLEREPLVVLDGAHNPGACEKLADALGEFEYDDLHVVFGAMHDKDHAEMAAALPTPDRVVTCEPDLDRAEDPAVLADVFEHAGAETVKTGGAVEDAVAETLDAAGENDCVLVTGSLFAVAEARTRWSRLQIPKRVRTREGARDMLDGASVREGEIERVAGEGVHRVLKTRVRTAQARQLKEELLRVGGECAVSELSEQDTVVDAVLLGTLDQFEALTDVLDDRSDGLETLAEEVRTALDLDDESAGRGYPWEDGTAVMGILNVTPDSFHDGGEYDAVEDAVARAEQIVAEGADIIDVGGESTRPGAEPVPVDAEIERVVPVVERIADLDAMVSVDTRRAEVARAALEAGADILNDVSGLEDPEMRFVAAEYDAPIVVMHSVNAPVDPDTDVEYDDVVEDVIDQLRERVLLAEKAGLDREQIIVDPGLGFAKSPAEAFELLDRADEFDAFGCPVLIGHSHKSMFALSGQSAGERGPPTVAASALAADRGADILRVHDVRENVAAVNVAAAASRDADE